MSKSTEYEMILFDLDGTLTDPKVGITNSVRYALSKLGITEESEERLISFIGAPLFICLQDYYSLSEAEARRAIDFYREYYSETGIYENAVYPGISELLEGLKSSGKRLVVATLKPAVFARRVLEHFGMPAFFEHVAGPDLDPAGLTKTEIIEEALAEMTGISKEKAVMVGDRFHDVVGARKNGIDSVAVTYGYGSREELQETNPDYIVDSIEDLTVLLLGSREIG